MPREQVNSHEAIDHLSLALPHLAFSVVGMLIGTVARMPAMAARNTRTVRVSTDRVYSHWNAVLST